jgi:hypothetical protein
MLHPCEPTLEELTSIRSALFSEDSTDMNLKKIRAIEFQIERHKKDRDAKKAQAKAKEAEQEGN